MAGTAVTTQEVRKFGSVIAERLITVVFTSDAAGSVPDEAIDNLYNYYLDEIITLPDSTSPPTSAYRVAVTDTDGDSIFFANGPLGNLTLSLANIVPAVTAHYLSGIGTSKLVFQWDSVAGNRGTDAAVVGTDAFDPTPTVLRDQAGKCLDDHGQRDWQYSCEELLGV